MCTVFWPSSLPLCVPFYYISLLGLAYRVRWTLGNPLPPSLSPHSMWMPLVRIIFQNLHFYFLCTNKMLLTSNYANWQITDICSGDKIHTHISSSAVIANPGLGFEKRVSGFDFKRLGYPGRVSGFQKCTNMALFGPQNEDYEWFSGFLII